MSMSGAVQTANSPARETVDAKEAFRRIGCSTTAGYAAIRRGDLPALHVGRRVYIPTAALDRLLAVTSPSDPLEAA